MGNIEFKVIFSMKNRRDGDTEEQGGVEEDEGELKGKETLRSQKRRMAKEFVCAF